MQIRMKFESRGYNNLPIYEECEAPLFIISYAYDSHFQKPAVKIL